jgi:hypothetical protein
MTDKVEFKVGDIVGRKYIDSQYSRNYGKVCAVDGECIWSNHWVSTFEEAVKLSQDPALSKTWIHEAKLLVVRPNPQASKLAKAVLEQADLVTSLQQQCKEAQARLDKLRLLLDNEALLNEIYFT